MNNFKHVDLNFIQSMGTAVSNIYGNYNPISNSQGRFKFLLNTRLSQPVIAA